MASPLARRVVLARIAGRSLALPIEHVIETMRPQPIEAIAPAAPGGPGEPPCVLGVARIRGDQIRVIDAARLFGLSSTDPPGRFVILRAGPTCLALQVDAVTDIRELGTGASIDPPVEIAALVPALRDARWIDDP